MLFKKVLVANRGEIAVRIIRALHELGIEAVAIYSEADRTSAHITMADEAYCVGPAPSRESYLHISKIIEAAKKSGAEALHPGYGFLSENDELAFACEEAGITFIGPSGDVLRRMGDKIMSREFMAKLKIPIVPGSREPIQSLEHAKKIATNTGYPIVVKASAGGGGKGMRIVYAEKDLQKGIEAAKREALSSFGDETIYIEKYLEEPHHIEIQVIGDKQGNILHLFERECSIQRRHQKVIEETPSPFITPKLRKKMCKVAVKAAKALKYVNAGTFEFLVDKYRNFYFLEMNTRLQVEHPITEMVTGIDIVKLQIKIAAGFPIPFKQKEINQRGHAIECRIYAEDPFNQFLPSPGKLITYRPPSGPFVRFDTYVYQGYTVPVHYDPLVGKLCVLGSTRQEAVERLARVLHEFVIKGIRNTLVFHRQVVHMSQFVQGKYDTTFIDKQFKIVKTKPTPVLRDLILAVAAIDAFQKKKQTQMISKKEVQVSAWNYAARREALRTELMRERRR